MAQSVQEVCFFYYFFVSGSLKLLQICTAWWHCVTPPDFHSRFFLIFFITVIVLFTKHYIFNKSHCCKFLWTLWQIQCMNLSKLSISLGFCSIIFFLVADLYCKSLQKINKTAVKLKFVVFFWVNHLWLLCVSYKSLTTLCVPLSHLEKFSPFKFVNLWLFLL